MKKLFSVRTIILAGSLLLQLNTLCFQSRGAAGDVDLSFDPGSGVNDEVIVVAAQSDSKIIIGGLFTTVRGLGRPHLARLNPDGSGDATFNAGPVVDRYVSAIAVQPDGRVIFARDFYNLTGAPPGIRAGRLNSDGTMDNSFALDLETFPEGSGFTCLALQPNGKVVLGGYSNARFTDGDGIIHYYRRSLLIRLNPDGSADPGFLSGNGTFGELINTLALQTDGKILIGGRINTIINGTNHYGIARLNADGGLDSSFNPGVDGTVFSVVVQPDGKCLIGGQQLGIGTNSDCIARLNVNGSLDSSFNPGTGLSGPFPAVESVATQSDGKVLIGGYFTTVNGTSRNNIARLNADGSLDGSFNPGTGTDRLVRSLALLSDGKVFIGGDFTTLNGTGREQVARLNVDGTLDGAFDPGASISGTVDSIVRLPAGKVLVSGDFTKVAGASRNRIARLYSHGGLDNSFNPGTGADAEVRSIASQPDGKVLIGGDFSVIDGVSRQWLARLNVDGGLDSSFSLGIGRPVGQSLIAQSIVILPDGRMLIGGLSPNSNGIERLNTDGSLDNTFNPETLGNTGGDYAWVHSLAVQSDGKILAGGYYVKVFGDFDYYDFLLTRLNADGSLDNTFNAGVGGFPLALQPDGKVLVGGYARLNADGTLDHSFNPGTGVVGDVHSMALQPDGKVLIGGSFTNVNGTNCNNIARLNANGSLDNSFNPGTGTDGAVRSIALQSDGNVLIGGEFTFVDGVVRPRVARLYGDSVAPSLNIARSNASVIVSWPVTGLNFQLQEATDLSLPNSWSTVAQSAVTNAGQISVTVPTTVGRKFFQLKSQ